MATHTRLFMSTDPGAPVFTATVGSLCDLLKTCLVGSGGVAYGSGSAAKAAAGWTVEFEDAVAHKLVLRNSPALGSGYYLRILDDGTGTSATAANAHAQGYSSMSDIDTGTDATPAAVVGWPGGRIEKAESAGSTPIPWAVVADEKTAIVGLNIAATDGRAVVYYLGDYLSYIPGFGYPWMTAAGGASNALADRVSYLSRTSGQASTGADGACIMRSHTGMLGAAKTTFVAPNGAAGSVPGSGSLPNIPPSGYLGNNIVSHPVMLASAIGPIGELRGVRYPSQDIRSIAGGTVLAGTLPGSMQVVLHNADSYGSFFDLFSGGLLIETVLPWQ